MADSPSRAPKTWSQRILVAIVFIVGVGGTAGVLRTEFLGQVIGTEFTPDSFKRRDFAYFRIPLIKLQISPVVRWDSSNDLEKHLRRNSLKGLPVRATRWDVASVNSGAKSESGDAAILCSYLDTKNKDDELLWLVWTKADEKRAKPLWKAVHDAAKLDAYVCIPELFELAEANEDAKELSDEIERYMAQSAERNGRRPGVA